jgi:UDP-N-acetylglucosamine 1-carboxyvinyltransferase
MDQIRIIGGRQLKGRLPISGAKNAALTLLPAALLTDEPLTLRNLPRLADVDTFGHLLNVLGASTHTQGSRPEDFGRVMTISASRMTSTTAPYDIVRKMRASILVLGPLLAREGVATVSQPGGCAIGNRPIDLHLKGLEALGAEIELTSGYVRAKAPAGGLRGGRIIFPVVSVGATENVLMAAVLAKGETVIENAAREPEIVDLANCLNAMGARISGVGTERLVVEGVDRLHGATYAVMPDRIEAGSYACAAAITGGEVVLAGVDRALMGSTLPVLEEAGVAFEDVKGGLKVSRANGLHGVTATTELARMGADITVKGRSAMVRGVAGLFGAPVMATDLRASMSLVIAGLAAEGETLVRRVYHLDRGYERLEEKLQAVGAEIERVSGD